jgi:hypothetical protein
VPYIDATALETYLGRVLTAAEAAQADTVIGAAEAAIDRYTGRTWSGTSVVDERHTIYGKSVYLNRKPVAAISSVTLRSPEIGATAIAQVSGSGYELLDAARGLLLVQAARNTILTVSYTVTVDVPDPIILAAQTLAAGWLGSAAATANQAQGIKSYSVGGELDVTYFTAAEGGAASSAMLPAGVRTLLDPYRRPLVFA